MHGTNNLIYSKMSADAVCRVCLVNNLNLYGVRNELQKVYEGITRQKYNKVGYPVRMCYICLSALKKCHRFMETARDADRLLTQWDKNEMGMAKPLSTYSITEATVFSMGNAHTSLKHDTKTEKNDLVEQLVGDVQTEKTECSNNVGTEKSDIDEPTAYSPMLVDSSTVTTSNDTTQVGDDKQTVPFSTNTNNEWSGLDVGSQHNNDNFQIGQITEVKSEIETNELIRLLSAHEIPKDLHTEIEIDETDDGDADDADDVCHTENFDIKFNPKSKVLKTKNTENGKTSHICDVCDKCCASAAGLKLHVVLKHTTKKKPKKQNNIFSSSVSSFKCTKQLHLTRHTTSHTGVKPFSCDMCDYKCKHKSVLKLHIRTHTGEKPFSCDMCDYKCTQKYYLIRHMKTHTAEKPFSCDICGYKSTQKYHVTRHIRTHTGEKPFSCDICDYKCVHKSTLKRHIRTHTGDKPFTCDICDYKFTRKCTLKLHLKSHTGEKPFSCDMCDYKCTQKHYLIRHMKTHTAEKPFSCDICGYKSTQKYHVTRHLRTHTGEKPFSCDICDYKCVQKSTLKRHIRTHTGDKPFTCDICDYKCTGKSCLTQHIRTHTGEN